MDVLLTIHDTLLTARGQRFFLFLFFFVFAMVSNAVDTMCFFRSAPNVKVVRISNKRGQMAVMSCSSPVASPTPCVVPSDQCDGNPCCPGFDGSVVCVVRCCVCVFVHVLCLCSCCVCLCGVCTVCVWSVCVCWESNMHALVVKTLALE